jgi:hypothetical protein
MPSVPTGLWGVLPLYWHMLGQVPPFELSYHRMVWSAAVRRDHDPRCLGRIGAKSGRRCATARFCCALICRAFIACNWTIYIYAIAKAQLVEASLGYYINPLLPSPSGVVMLGEKCRRCACGDRAGRCGGDVQGGRHRPHSLDCSRLGVVLRRLRLCPQADAGGCARRLDHRDLPVVAVHRRHSAFWAWSGHRRLHPGPSGYGHFYLSSAGRSPPCR